MFSAWFRALTTANSGQPVVRIAATANSAGYGDILQCNFKVEKIEV